MDSLFGRKKGRPRQSSVSAQQDLNERSVPYDKLGPPPRSPLPVGTVSQGFRGISAPNTNPSLTASGTEINKYAMQRSKVERERLYDLHGYTRPGSPSTSVSTADSSTLYDESLPSSSSKHLPQTPQSSRVRLSEASTSSGARSPIHDFGHFSASTSTSSATIRPLSSTTTRSETSRASKYAPSLSSSESGTHHSLFYHTRSGHHSSSNSFYFPRPDTDEEIEIMFEEIKRTRDLGVLPDLALEQKWHMVYNSEHIRWKEEKIREEANRRHHESGLPSSAVDTPESYIKKFLDKTITHKQATSLLVSLRSREVDWFRHFVGIQGTSVLAQTLMHNSRKNSARRENDILLEYEIAKCLRQIFNSSSAATAALTHPLIVTQIAATLNTPNLATRKLIVDLLCFICYFNDGEALNLVVAGLEALSSSNNEGGGCYDFWFKSMEYSLSGRGKMGSLVGASEEIKRSAGVDSSMNDYALSNLLLIIAIISHIDDVDLRLHHRAQMEAAGLQRIVTIFETFNYPNIDVNLKNLYRILDEDERKLRERLDQEILRDLNNPQDVYNAIYARTQETKARDHFLSMMQHLLLIREEGQPMVHYYQLIDSLVTDVVMDKKLAGAEQRMGHSVERIIAQFNEADRYQTVEAEATEARMTAARLRLEKEALEEEVAQGQEGLVGKLKSQLAHAEEKLNVSRETTSRLQGQLTTQKEGYEEQIAQLEAQIMELFRMLKEVGKGMDTVLEGGGLDRKTLVQQLEKDFQRRKTIQILEGREGHSKRVQPVAGSTDVEDVEEEDLDATPGKASLRRSRAAGSKKKAMAAAAAALGGKEARVSIIDENGRVSQFMDADDAHAQEQIQQQLEAGANLYQPSNGSVSSSRSVRGSPRRTDRLPLGPTTPYKSTNLLSPPDEISELGESSRSPSPVGHDDDSEYTQSTRSGSTTLTEDTALTSATEVKPFHRQN
ncbi:hypothetical protein C0991_002241 [Blastosporella zonata]|nr:hypothetical protein C0991_002241 [Blastosporella zonata]